MNNPLNLLTFCHIASTIYWIVEVELCCFVPVLLILRLMETWLVENLKWKFL